MNSLYYAKYESATAEIRILSYSVYSIADSVSIEQSKKTYKKGKIGTTNDFSRLAGGIPNPAAVSFCAQKQGHLPWDDGLQTVCLFFGAYFPTFYQ